MQRRWREWTVIGFLAFYFSLPFWRYSEHLVLLASYYYFSSTNLRIQSTGYWPYFALALTSLVGIWTFVALARFALALVRPKSGSLRLQLQLRTMWVLSVAASILLYLNLKSRYLKDHVYEFGFPEKLYKPGLEAIGPMDVVKSHLNLFVFLTLLVTLGAVCELVLWRRESASKTQTEPETPAESCALETMTQREKWFATIPLFLLFALIWSCGIPIVSVPYELSYYRDLSAFSLKLQAFVALCEKYFLTVIVLMIFAAWGFLQFVCRERRNVRRFNRVVWIVAFALLFSLSMTLTEAYFPSPRGMRKK